MYTNLYILTHTCDVMVSFPHVSMCSYCVEWLHVLVGWYFIPLFLSQSISLSHSLTHARAHTHTHTHRCHVSLSAPLLALSWIMHFILPSFSCLFPFVLTLVTALTLVTTWQLSEWKKTWINRTNRVTCPDSSFLHTPHVFPFHLFPSNLKHGKQITQNTDC